MSSTETGTGPQPGWQWQAGDGPRPDTGTLVAWVRDRLAVHGMAHLRWRISEEDFTAVAGGLGTLQLRTDLQVDPQRDAEQRRTRAQGKINARPGVYQASELALHADRPTVDVLAWYCIEQDELDGSLHLVDTADIAAHLAAADLRALGRIPVGYTLRDPVTWEETWHQEPLAVPRGGGFRIYYAPWLVAADLDAEQARALDAFSRYVERKQSGAKTVVRLEKGESLFIDNHRLLHGRGALLEHSRRHIVRFYVGAPA